MLRDRDYNAGAPRAPSQRSASASSRPRAGCPAEGAQLAGVAERGAGGRPAACASGPARSSASTPASSMQPRQGLADRHRAAAGEVVDLRRARRARPADGRPRRRRRRGRSRASRSRLPTRMTGSCSPACDRRELRREGGEREARGLAAAHQVEGAHHDRATGEGRSALPPPWSGRRGSAARQAGPRGSAAPPRARAVDLGARGEDHPPSRRPRRAGSRCRRTLTRKYSSGRSQDSPTCERPARWTIASGWAAATARASAAGSSTSAS